MSSRVAKEMYLSLLDYSMLFIHKKIQICTRQWENVCNSGQVLFGSKSYQNDWSNSCHSMNILSIQCSHEFQSCKRDVFESSCLQHAFYTQTIQVCPRQWEYVCNSGGHCLQQWRLHHGDQMLIRTAQKLIVTEGFYSVRKGSSRTLTITYYFMIKMCWKNVNSFDSMSNSIFIAINTENSHKRKTIDKLHYILGTIILSWFLKRKNGCRHRYNNYNYH